MREIWVKLNYPPFKMCKSADIPLKTFITGHLLQVRLWYKILMNHPAHPFKSPARQANAEKDIGRGRTDMTPRVLAAQKRSAGQSISSMR